MANKVKTLDESLRGKVSSIIARGSINKPMDWDTILDSGTYSVMLDDCSASLNMPSGIPWIYGVLEVINPDIGPYAIQRLTSHDCEIWQRIRKGSGWSAWVKLSATTVGGGNFHYISCLTMNAIAA